LATAEVEAARRLQTTARQKSKNNRFMPHGDRESNPYRSSFIRKVAADDAIQLSRPLQKRRFMRLKSLIARRPSISISIKNPHPANAG
jgi:hypothetical protein